MHNPDPPKQRHRRPTAFLVGNLLLAIFMLAAIPFVRNGQNDFASFAKLDKRYVTSVLADGRLESLEDALKQTEVARALGHKEHVTTLGMIQFAAMLMAGLFFLNTLLIYRMRQSQPVRVRWDER